MPFEKNGNILTLDDILKSSWRTLYNGVQNFRHPFHKPTLTTMDDDKPQARIVILRGFSEKDRTLISHCDARSPKVSQIQDNPNVTWLFYHPEKWMQVRLSGTASVHTDDKTAESQWEKVRLTHRINYCAEIPPGSPRKNRLQVCRVCSAIKQLNCLTIRRPAKILPPLSADLINWIGCC